MNTFREFYKTQLANSIREAANQSKNDAYCSILLKIRALNFSFANDNPAAPVS